MAVAHLGGLYHKPVTQTADGPSSCGETYDVVQARRNSPYEDYTVDFEGSDCGKRYLHEDFPVFLQGLISTETWEQFVRGSNASLAQKLLWDRLSRAILGSYFLYTLAMLFLFIAVANTTIHIALAFVAMLLLVVVLLLHCLWLTPKGSQHMRHVQGLCDELSKTPKLKIECSSRKMKLHVRVWELQDVEAPEKAEEQDKAV